MSSVPISLSDPVRSSAVDDATDVIAAAVAIGMAARHGKGRPPRRLQGMVDRVRNYQRARHIGVAAKSIDALLAIIRDYPEAEHFQIVAARLLDGEDTPDLRGLRWEGVVSRFPYSHEAFCGLVAAVQRRSGTAAVRALIEQRCSERAFALQHVIGDLRDNEATSELLISFFRMEEEDWLRIDLAGNLNRLSFTAGSQARLPNAQRWRQLGLRFADIGKTRFRTGRLKSRASSPVLGDLLSIAVSRREASMTTGPRRAPQSIVILSGSLGAGGSERQMVQTAIGLKNVMSFSPHDIKLFVRNAHSRRDGLFFQPDLAAAGIGIQHIGNLPEFGGDLTSSILRPLSDSLPLLSQSIRYTTTRLADELNRNKPDIVHLWQDGIVYNAGLAALVACVPRIVLSTRSVPPVDRPDRNRPEYSSIYRSLLGARNVSLTVNSRYAADRFSEWLEIDKNEIAIIPNGVAALAADGDIDAADRFGKFDAATRDACLTLGTVMRMDQNKRPLLWIEVAAQILKTEPRARFILVGDGVLRTQAMNRVASLGIADRFAFVGLSRHVGFWLSKMDLFLLTSKYEGLPNALIEAQLAGVPVITTPAGGAPEALIPGITGIVTSQAASAEEIAVRVLVLAANTERRRRMVTLGAKWAADAFSVKRMLELTMDLFNAPSRPVAN